MPEPVVTTHVVGIDIGMESCTMACLTMNKRQVIKSTPFANTRAGFDWLFERLEGLGVTPQELLVGLEATSRYGENLLQALLKRGYQVCLLHPAQMHAFAQQRGVRAKTDRLDAVTIARALLSGEARCAPRVGTCELCKRFGKDFPGAGGVGAIEATNMQHESNSSSTSWQILDGSPVVALQAARRL
jgi:transposase